MVKAPDIKVKQKVKPLEGIFLQYLLRLFGQASWPSPWWSNIEQYWAKLWSINNKNSKFCKFCHKIWFWNWIIYNEKSNCRLLLDFLFSFYFPLSVKLAEHPEFSACLSESDCYREGCETPFGRGGGLAGDQGGQVGKNNILVSNTLYTYLIFVTRATRILV